MTIYNEFMKIKRKIWKQNKEIIIREQHINNRDMK